MWQSATRPLALPVIVSCRAAGGCPQQGCVASARALPGGTMPLLPHDLFISHASEDKAGFVEPLVVAPRR